MNAITKELIGGLCFKLEDGCERYSEHKQMPDLMLLKFVFEDYIRDHLGSFQGSPRIIRAAYATALEHIDWEAIAQDERIKWELSKIRQA